MVGEIITRRSMEQRLEYFDDDYYHHRKNRFYVDLADKISRREIRDIEVFHKSLEKISAKDAKSLWYEACNLENISWLDLDDDDYISKLRLHLDKFDNPINEFNNLVKLKLSHQLSSPDLNWFENDLRCSLFLIYICLFESRKKAFKGGMEAINFIYDFIRYESDLFVKHGSLPEVVDDILLREAKISPQQHLSKLKKLYLSNRCSDKLIKWINPQDPVQIDRIYEYLSNEERNHIILSNIFFPENTDDKYALILASLDVLSNVPDPNIGTKKNKGMSERDYVLHSLHNALRTADSYAKTKKKEGDVSIKVYARNLPKLEALLEFSKLTKNQIINKHIEEAYEFLLDSNEEFKSIVNNLK